MYNLPKWTTEFIRFLSVTPQFSFTGNILDVYPVEIDGNLTTLRLKDYIRTILVKEGYEIVLGLEPYTGFTHLHGDPDTIHAVLGDVLSAEKKEPPTPERTIEILQKSVENRTAYSAVILNHISRHDDRYAESCSFFYKLFYSSQHAEPRLLAGSSYPRFNLIIWIHDPDAGLPDWYVRNNTRVRQIVIPRPDGNVRRALLESLTRNVPLIETEDETVKRDSVSLLVRKTENLQANEIISLVSLIRRDILSTSDLSDAVIRYTSGLAENFWPSIDRKQIGNADSYLGSRVYGQNRAVKRVSSLLSQAYLGLSRSQYLPDFSQPRGILVLAGHEGVGKTTLAYTIKDLLIGPDGEMITLNMSDYQDEDACSCLSTLSSSGNGNFLCKVLKNPYSIILFENIGSAPPALLKLITSIIRDGGIVCDDGTRVSFTGCLILCTIRLQGSYSDVNLYARVQAETAKNYVTGERTAEESIERFFVEHQCLDLSPIIRGNTIVLRNIDKNAGKLILDDMINRICERISVKYHVSFMLSPSVKDQVEEFCCNDLTRGGTGIGQRVEAMVLDPLSHVLIQEPFVPGEKVIITQISDSESGWEVNLSRVG